LEFEGGVISALCESALARRWRLRRAERCRSAPEEAGKNGPIKIAEGESLRRFSLQRGQRAGGGKFFGAAEIGDHGLAHGAVNALVLNASTISISCAGDRHFTVQVGFEYIPLDGASPIRRFAPVG
jgi:hypothetical protein